MRKIVMAVLCSLLVMTGCSKKEKPVDTALPVQIEIKSASQLEDQLSQTGWQTQTTSAASFHLWEQLNPLHLILAENRSDECLVIAEFSSEEDAIKAYSSLVPSGKESSAAQDTDQYKQALVSLEDNEGSWMFRQVDTWVFGGCASTAQQAGGFDALFNSFQTGQQAIAPQTGSDETTGPSDSSTLSSDADKQDETDQQDPKTE